MNTSILDSNSRCLYFNISFSFLSSIIYTINMYHFVFFKLENWYYDQLNVVNEFELVT